jgi:hypothetical protein
MVKTTISTRRKRRSTYLISRESDQSLDQQLATVLRRPVDSSSVNALVSRVLREQLGGSSSASITVWKNGTAPERDDVPALIPPFDDDGPATEECDVPRARQIGVHRWLSWQMLLSKKNFTVLLL